jgi:hypothetical protein
MGRKRVAGMLSLVSLVLMVVVIEPLPPSKKAASISFNNMLFSLLDEPELDPTLSARETDEKHNSKHEFSSYERLFFEKEYSSACARHPPRRHCMPCGKLAKYKCACGAHYCSSECNVLHRNSGFCEMN